MAAYVKFNCFVFDLGSGKHDLANDQVRIYLSNATPDAANHTIKSEIAEITAANGYNNTQLSGQNWVQAANITTLGSNADIQWTANAGNFGPFRYVVMFNANSDANLANCALVSYWDYGSSISCNNGESFTFDVPANGTIANIT